MLRISTHENPGSLTFLLEGTLAGPWVRVMEECWQDTVPHSRTPRVSIDLTEVTFIDSAGKECLIELHDQGANLVAAGCLMRALVAEISGARPPTLSIRERGQKRC